MAPPTNNLAYLPFADEPEFGGGDEDGESYEVEECDFCGNKTFILRLSCMEDDRAFFERVCANIDCQEEHTSVYLEYELEE